MEAPQRRIAGLAALAVVVVSTTMVARRHHHARTGEWFGGPLSGGWFEEAPDGGAAVEADAAPDAATLAWCADGLEAIAGGGCFAPGPRTGSPLVLYLHGIFDPAAASEELGRQTRVAARARAAGFSVLALRGHVGECSAPEYAARVCWPSNERNEDAGPAFVAEWSVPLAVAARRGASGRRYVLGFSNGGYFAGLLAERGWFSAEGFVVARGGPVAPVKASKRKTPILLTLSDGDPSHEEMVKLDEALAIEGWPHDRFVSHGGHELPDGDIEAAVDFFTELERAAR